MRRSRAFTLVELLVVVAIMGLLMAILLPSLGAAREASRRTVCGTNLKSQGSALAIYAQQFQDCLPAFANGAGYWVHDEPFEFGESLLNTTTTAMNNMGATSVRRWFYCPSNAAANVDTLWDYGTLHNLTYRAMGYTYLNDRGAAGGAGNFPPLPARAVPPLAYRSRFLSTPNPADNELVLDEILSPDNNGASSSFNLVPTGNAAQSTTSHLKGTKPAGANVLSFDGHVGWRSFRTSNTGLLAIPNASASFAWIINP